MKRFYRFILFVCISLIAFNCQKEISYSGPGNNNNSNSSTRTIQGNIVDENGQPASGVKVTIGNKSVSTNAKGYFRITGAVLDKNSSTALVSAEKAGYFKALRSFLPTKGTNYVKIKLTKKTSAGTINAANGGSVSLSNGAIITLPSNRIVKASDNSSYPGNIKVYATYIDPTASDIDQIVPGSFMADDKNNKRVTLASYGMLAVELESSTGEKLQIAQGATATLTTPIPSSRLASAPATIPLWYVDEQTGIWKEEGVATKTGNNYVGEVKHFTFWNCDVPLAAVKLSLALKTDKGLPIVHVLVKIVSSTVYGQAGDWTDSLGNVSGMVPANESLTLQVIDPCYNVAYSKNIGPFSQETNLGAITVTSLGSAMLTIQGKLKNCNNTIVTSGYAIINYDNVTRFASVNSSGDFAISFLRCAASPVSCDIIGVDASAVQQGNTTSVAITTPVTNAGDIIACGISSMEYINYKIDNTDYSITGAHNDSLFVYSYAMSSPPPLASWFRGLNWSNGDNISLYFSHNAAPGTYNIVSFSAQTYDTLMTIVPPFTVTISSYPQNVGNFYEGSFSGKFKESVAPFTQHPVTGTFRLRRNN